MTNCGACDMGLYGPHPHFTVNGGYSVMQVDARADRIEDLARINAELRRNILATTERCELLSAAVDDLHLTIAGQRNTIDAAKKRERLLQRELDSTCEQVLALQQDLNGDERAVVREAL